MEFILPSFIYISPLTSVDLKGSMIVAFLKQDSYIFFQLALDSFFVLPESKNINGHSCSNSI